MYKQGNSVMDYLNPKKSTEPRKKAIWKQIWKWTKVVLFLFVIISMLWGCVQMYQSAYMVQTVTDAAGNSIYAPGTTFEIVIHSLGEQMSGKNHMFIGGIANMQEYSYNAISSWGDAFRVTQSPFYGFFVYPLAYILIGLIRGFAGTLNPGLDGHQQAIYGVSVMFAMLITVILLRCLVLCFSWKQQVNQDQMQDMQMKQAEITAKYKGKKSASDRQKQQLEMQALRKKQGGPSPMGTMASSFAPLPFLFAFYAIIRASRALKIANVGAISLIEQPWHQLTHGQPVYLAILAVYLPLQIISMMLPIFLQYRRQKGQHLTEAQRKSRRRSLIIQIVMAVVFIFIVASIATGVAIYWIYSSTFQICQTLGFHYYNQHKKQSGNKERQRRLRQAKNQKSKATKALH